MKKIKPFFSLKQKMLFNSFIILIPLGVLTGYLIFSLIHFGNAYNQIVKNITIANSYNINFKDQVDYSMYKIVIGAVGRDKLEKKSDIQNPYELIDDARRKFEYLKNITVTKSNLRRIDMLLKDLDTLSDRIDDIMANIEASGKYDENINLLEMNVYILTEIIQEQIQDYIYYEASNFEIIRSELEKNLKTAITVSLAAFAFILAGGTAVSAFVTQSIARPVRRLYEATKKVSAGDFSIRVPKGGTYELSGLAESFNQMTERIGMLVEDIKTEKENKRLAELRLLQAQINPHFLYNTLDAISWLAEGGQNEKVVEMIGSLSRFFRLSLSEGRDFITVREEEAHVRSYLEIQKARYQDILEYEIDIDRSLHEYSCLKLLLQPLAENALYHGIKEKRGKGLIRISGRFENGDIIFCVSDNGAGIPEKELERISCGLQKGSLERGKGFGLSNVDERIKLNYGENYGIRLESVLGEGTSVFVKIPALSGKF
ncbi:MAG: two-component system, sensor histidine kinase YesM [Clostridiales bacterium]|jgi:two-component system sensor histidine kinase YesM|nr:histidine kinase [Oscillospiraceae bacterium]MDN5377880.1 two-component system, sensor histidine kinase YesM [Clostridiales bacterium]